eukprot:4304551-Alexandrium_andersonii.AAC.1
MCQAPSIEAWVDDQIDVQGKARDHFPVFLRFLVGVSPREETCERRALLGDRALLQDGEVIE